MSGATKKVFQAQPRMFERIQEMFKRIQEMFERNQEAVGASKKLFGRIQEMFERNQEIFGASKKCLAHPKVLLLRTFYPSKSSRISNCEDTSACSGTRASCGEVVLPP
jgi:hypothetical protein